MGIFVGGRGLRMGGAAKGLLVAEDGAPLLTRLRAACETLALPVVIVGPAASRAPYAALADGLAGVDDDPRAEGPLAGLLALLTWAEASATRRVIALACDMPYVDAAALAELVAAPEAPAVAARRDGHWEPFFARYDVARVLPAALEAAAARRLGLQRLLDDVGATPLALAKPRALEDWDTPADLPRGPGRDHDGER